MTNSFTPRPRRNFYILLVMDFFSQKTPPWPIFVFWEHTFFLVHPVCINQWNETHHPEPKIYLKICFKKNKIAQLAQKIVREMSSTTCSSCSSIWEAVGWYLLLKYWGILGRRKNRRKQMIHKQPNLNNSLIFKFKPKWFLLWKIFSYYYSLLLIFVVNLTKRIIRGDTKLSGNIFKFLYPHYKP